MSQIKPEDGFWTDVGNSQRPVYTYKALLKPSQIRLAKLHPLKLEDGPRGNRVQNLSPLWIGLTQTVLEEARDFIGISYT